MSFENYFDHLQNMGSMLSDEQKDDLKKMGEKFYGSIDMEKYKPVPTEEFNQESFSEDFIMSVKYSQLKKALDSGLLEEDLTEEEREILKVKKD